MGLGFMVSQNLGWGIPIKKDAGILAFLLV